MRNETKLAFESGDRTLEKIKQLEEKRKKKEEEEEKNGI